MGILDYLRAAIEPAAAARVGYNQGQEREQDKRRQTAIQDQALNRQSLLDQITAELHKSQIDENAARARNYDRGSDDVVWKQEADGTFTPLPKRIPRTGAVGASGASSGMASPETPQTGDFGAPTVDDFARSLTGRSADTTSKSATSLSPLATVRAAVRGDGTGQASTFEMGKSTGIKGPTPRAAAPRIDPNSPAGISADSSKAANRRRIAVNNPLPSRTGSGRASATQASQQERYFNSIAQNAITAADPQIPATTVGDERNHQREQLAMQSLLGNPKTANVFSQGMSSRHIQAANEKFIVDADKRTQSRARTESAVGSRSYTPLKEGTSSSSTTSSKSAPSSGAKLPALTPAQLQRAAQDPEYKKFKESQGYTIP